MKFSPGSLFKIKVGGDEYAYALMLAEFPYVAFYGKDVSIDDAGALEGSPMFVVAVEKSAYAAHGWGEFLHRIPKGNLPGIPRFFWQSPVRKNDCKIVEPIKHRVPAKPSECIGLEAEAVWSFEHIESRIIDSYAGRPNHFVESLRVKL
ncbi:hypothetical protein [Nocardiopsis sp. NRRL B-16309]|uniref:hypothetical protein n=1 Tax=Nocardiopsis sp. NRRL B-16309 TaxID=1519494 RepID=UPI0012E298E2|nr:hypothetical protein [Nocardiopsis sp. NRRL B-16309]